jgi:hypothetical protein
LQEGIAIAREFNGILDGILKKIQTAIYVNIQELPPPMDSLKL